MAVKDVREISSKGASDDIVAFLNGLISDEDSVSVDPSPRAMIPRSALSCVGYICDIPEHGEFKYIADPSAERCVYNSIHEKTEVIDLRNVNGEYFKGSKVFDLRKARCEY